MTVKSNFDAISPGMQVKIYTRHRLNNSYSFDDLQVIMGKKHNSNHTMDSAHLTARKAISIIPKVTTSPNLS